MKTPTLETIANAFNKASEQGRDYDVILLLEHTEQAGGGADYMVSHKTEYKTRTYMVSVYTTEEKTTCNCPEHERSGFCKHGALCVSDFQTRTDAAQWEATEGDRFFMAECQNEVLASVAGEWWG
jgi:hypothetical protein